MSAGHWRKLGLEPGCHLGAGEMDTGVRSWGEGGGQGGGSRGSEGPTVTGLLLQSQSSWAWATEEQWASCTRWPSRWGSCCSAGWPTSCPTGGSCSWWCPRHPPLAALLLVLRPRPGPARFAEDWAPTVAPDRRGGRRHTPTPTTPVSCRWCPLGCPDTTGWPSLRGELPQTEPF